jgi:Uma2 family endonuclease
MASTIHWTSADLASLPQIEGTRYEIIAGELFVSTTPHFNHQILCGRLFKYLESWNDQSKLGQTVFTPGLIFADDDDVIPDVVWLSHERLAAILKDGKLRAAPELVIEVLSPGSTNQRRDRVAKLGLYSRRGVSEYWIVDWKTSTIEVHRQQDDQLTYVVTLAQDDLLSSPLLPNFSARVDDLFASLP